MNTEQSSSWNEIVKCISLLQDQVWKAEAPPDSDYLSLSRYLRFISLTLKTFVRYLSLSHLPKVSIWSKKGLESPVPPVEASGNALQTSRLCHIENLLFELDSNTTVM